MFEFGPFYILCPKTHTSPSVRSYFSLQLTDEEFELVREKPIIMPWVLKLESDSSGVHEVGALPMAQVAPKSTLPQLPVLQTSARGWGAAQVHGKALLEAQ